MCILCVSVYHVCVSVLYVCFCIMCVFVLCVHRCTHSVLCVYLCTHPPYYAARKAFWNPPGVEPVHWELAHIDPG